MIRLALLLAILAAPASAAASPLFEAMLAEASLCPALLDMGKAEDAGRPITETQITTGVAGVRERESHHPEGTTKLVFVEIVAQDHRLGFCGGDTIALQTPGQRNELQAAFRAWHAEQIAMVERFNIPCEFCPEFHSGVVWCEGGKPVSFTGLVAPATGNVRIGVGRRQPRTVAIKCDPGN